MKVQNKVIIVSGGSGIGRELVFNLLPKHARVIAIDINEPALQETVALAGIKKFTGLQAFYIKPAKRDVYNGCCNKQILSL